MMSREEVIAEFYSRLNEEERWLLEEQAGSSWQS